MMFLHLPPISMRMPLGIAIAVLFVGICRNFVAFPGTGAGLLFLHIAGEGNGRRVPRGRPRYDRVFLFFFFFLIIILLLLLLFIVILLLLLFLLLPCTGDVLPLAVVAGGSVAIALVVSTTLTSKLQRAG